MLPQDFRNVAVKSPLNPVEILSQYNPNEDIFILVRSERDPVPYKRKDGSPAYYQPFEGIDKCVPFNSQGGHGYVFVTKKEDFSINGQQVYSGTQVRELYQQANDTGRNRIIKDMYPKSPNQAKIRQILDMYIGSAVEPKQVKPNKVVKPKVSAVKKLQANPLQERVLKVIQTARPMLSEATVEQKVKLLKIMKEAISEEKKRLDPSCWEGYHKAGTKMKGGTRVNNCVPNESIEEDTTEEQVNEISDETLQSYLGKAELQVSNRLARMSQASDRLNKNYEIYDTNNPAKIIDRFEAGNPKLAKQYFDKFVQEYNPGDSDFHFDVRRSTGIMEDYIDEK